MRTIKVGKRVIEVTPPTDGPKNRAWYRRQPRAERRAEVSKRLGLSDGKD